LGKARVEPPCQQRRHWRGTAADAGADGVGHRIKATRRVASIPSATTDIAVLITAAAGDAQAIAGEVVETGGRYKDEEGEADCGTDAGGDS
jgi:hypothetical protein